MKTGMATGTPGALLTSVRARMAEPGIREWPSLGLKLVWSVTPEVPGSVLQKPACLLVLQGGKVLRQRKRRWRAGPGDAILVNLPMLVVCDAAEVDDLPLIALSVDLDMAVLAELHALGCPPLNRGRRPVAIEEGLHLGTTDPPVADAALRLLEVLDDPLTEQALGQSRLRELHFWLLRSPLGGPLHRLVADRTRMAAVVRAVQHLRQHPEQTPAMATLARDMAMSPSGFYALFSQVMGTSPLQYLKTLRLHRARQLLAQGGWRVEQVATEVGYSSTSQFSREFRRMFGVNPSSLL